MFKGLILIDNDQIDYSLDLVEVVNRLAGEEETCVYGLGINLPEEVKGLDAVINVEMPTLQLKDSRVVTDIIEQVHRKYQFN
ncbi:MAG: electron transfer flavoprotein subunit alpha/FixB family protein, partial [Enterococcus hulanensis]